jgi:hypothetical protein
MPGQAEAFGIVDHEEQHRYDQSEQQQRHKHSNGVETRLLEPALVFAPDASPPDTPQGKKSSRTDNLSCADADNTPAPAAIPRTVRIESENLLILQSPD